MKNWTRMVRHMLHHFCCLSGIFLVGGRKEEISLQGAAQLCFVNSKLARHTAYSISEPIGFQAKT